MVAVRTLTRAAAILILMTAGSSVWYACTDGAPEPPSGPAAHFRPDFRTVLAVQRRHTEALLDLPGVVGTAVTRLPDGRLAVQVLLERPGIAGVPQALDGVPVAPRITGRLVAFSDPTARVRPAPLGYSVGHPAITAGTIGARVRDALGRVYILSNNHVLANSNGATIGDAAYQPGPFDGGTAADQIATLSDFQPITFSASASNTMDAAIALSSTAVLDNATPADDGYGLPNATIYGDADGDGLFDDRNALLGLAVQKYGRTTGLTHGEITGVNATVSICYAVSGISCTKSARFVDQLLISPGPFSGGGDSGSLIVTDDANVNPVALLFAGSSSVTIANRIDQVLIRFGVTIDGFAPPPPGPLTDLAVTGVTGPSAVVQGDTGSVTVTVRNFGNQDVAAFDVTLQDTTAQLAVGTQTVSGLAAGATASVPFAWAPASTGEHTLLARQTLADAQPANDQRSVTIPVKPPVTDLAVTALTSAGAAIVGHTIDIAVTVRNVGNRNVADPIAVTLRDTTAGVELGTQTVTGLAAGATTLLTFSWNTTGAALGTHILEAHQTRADDNAANDRRTGTVQVQPKPTDIALTGITAPARVTQGDTAHVVVTVRNVGEVDVDTTFAVVLTDGTYGGVTVGTGMVAGLAVGATTTVDIPWNTAGADTAGHILIATQKLPDANGSNNAIAIMVIVKPRLSTDIAVTAVSAPAAVTQGSTASIAVTVQNVGGLSVDASFDVVLTDQTAGVTIGTQTVAGLAASGNTTRMFSWNTATAAPGGHTLVATHSLADDNAANNQRTAAVTVNPPSSDVAVTAVSAPASVTQGSTVTIGVTVQNVGGFAVASSFDVVLTDQTAGVTLGAQTVTGLDAGASATRSFSWNTADASLGGHTVVATQTLADDNAANDRRSATVTLTAPPVDLALTGITAPGSVTQGDTVPVTVTVQNVGGVDVGASFDVVLTDGTADVAIDTQTVAGLAAGAGTAVTFLWNTAGVALNGHILIARQMLVDNNASNNSYAIAVTVNAPSVHTGDLDGAAAGSGNSWSATVVVTVHDTKHVPLGGVTVTGNWNGSGPVGQCITAEGADAGMCTVVLSAIPNSTRMVSFGVTGMARSGYVYKPAGNHDPDGSSNGYSVTVKRQ